MNAQTLFYYFLIVLLNIILSRFFSSYPYKIINLFNPTFFPYNCHIFKQLIYQYFINPQEADSKRISSVENVIFLFQITILNKKLQMEEQKPKKTPSYLNAFLTILLSFGGLAFVYWAFNNPEMIKQCSLLENVRFKKTKDQIKLLSTILFVNILAVLGLGILRMILLKLNKFPESSPAMIKMQHYAWKCLQHSIVSLSFYAFILTQGRYNLTNQQLTIFALCIMASILTMSIGSAISSLLNYNFVQLGIMMNSLTNILMLGEMIGFQLLSYI